MVEFKDFNIHSSGKGPSGLSSSKVEGRLTIEQEKEIERQKDYIANTLRSLIVKKRETDPDFMFTRATW